MLTFGQVILTKKKDDKDIPISFIRECFIRMESSTLCIYAETLNTVGKRCHHAVTDISKRGGKVYVSLNELDYTPELNDNEKVIDIRDFQNNPK